MDEHWIKVMETRERMKWQEYLDHVVVVYSLNHIWLFCNLMDCSPPGSSVHGISQASILDWVALPFLSPGDLPDSGIEPVSSIANRFFTAEPLKWKWSCSVVSNSATPWTIAYQASPSMGFSRREYWSGLPFWGVQNEERLKHQGGNQLFRNNYLCKSFI